MNNLQEEATPEAMASKNIQTATYKLKEGTTSSYYKQGGELQLPNRICLTMGSEMSRTQKVGRNAYNIIIGQMLSTFTKKESSPLKKVPPYNCRTQIWATPSHPNLMGFGTLGISTTQGVKDTGGLLVFQSIDKKRLIKICLIEKIENKLEEEQALKYANEHLSKI